jgi:hypothetical protein
MHTKFWSKSLKGKDNLEDLGVYRIILKWISKKDGWKVWAGFHSGQPIDIKKN